uniref:Uncharacterized protein n=1 Tax=Rhodopseudomonas palustris (strain BisA53) TaxID=316055 RepID=Q07JQ9_RHOP5
MVWLGDGTSGIDAPEAEKSISEIPRDRLSVRHHPAARKTLIFKLPMRLGAHEQRAAFRRPVATSLGTINQTARLNSSRTA